jgi:hypothetical protein
MPAMPRLQLRPYRIKNLLQRTKPFRAAGAGVVLHNISWAASPWHINQPLPLGHVPHALALLPFGNQMMTGVTPCLGAFAPASRLNAPLPRAVGRKMSVSIPNELRTRLVIWSASTSAPL